jgi:prophage DNA circulation protein
MSWRDRLVPASFRGVPFQISSSAGDFGRRSVQHEYPLRDEPYSEDLGRKKQEFQIEAFVIGEDYMDQRNKLIKACEGKSGRGRLEHPYYGTKFVVCTGCKVSETTEEGRMARISLSFVEAGKKKFPSGISNFLSQLGISGDGLISSALGNFSQVFNVLDYPNFVLDEADEVVNGLADSLLGIGGIGDDLSGFSQNVQGLLDDFSTLAQTPATLGQSIIDSITSIGDIGLDFGDLATAYKSFLDFGSDETGSIFTGSGDVATTRAQINVNRDIINSLVIMTAIAQASIAVVQKAQQSVKPNKIIVRDTTPLDPLHVSAQQVYPTYESIIVERQEILDALELQIERTLSDEVYQSLQTQKRTLIQAFPDPELDLPNLTTFQNNQTRPCLVIAYDLYEKIEMEIDIIKRNGLEYPGFVPGGTTLEVISNG